MKELIYKVTDVIAEGKVGDMLRVTAHGQTNTSNWTEIELRLRCVADDAIELDFVGKPPADGANDVLTDVAASFEIPILPGFPPKSVTVVAATNKIAREIDYHGKKRVYEVTEASAFLDFNEIEVGAKGFVNSTGWTEPELRMAGGDKVELVALPPPPDAIVQPLMTPIEAPPATFGPYLPPFLEEITVIAETNHKTVDVQPRPRKVRIHEVTFLAARDKEGHILEVRAQGRTSTPGWTELELALAGESDETLHFDFLGVPPSEPVAQVITDTPEISFEMPLMPIYPRFVSVAAATSSLTRRIEYAAEKERVMKVDRVTTRWEGNTVHVQAQGTTRTFAWIFAELRPLESSDAFEFELVGVPGGPPALGTIEATVEIGPLMPPYPNILRIVAETNSVTCRLHASEAPSDKALVDELKAVEAILGGTELNVHAEGTVYSGGWTDIELRFLGRFEEVAEYAFVGKKPEIATTPLVDVEGFARDLLRPPFPNSVTVLAANGAITVPIQEGAAATARTSKRSAARPTA